MDDQHGSGPHVVGRLRGQLRRPVAGPADRSPPGPASRPSHGVRSAYDREIAEVKDNVLRMGSMVEAQIRAAIAALVGHDAEAALRVIIDDRQINEVQRKATAMIAAIDRHPEPGRARPALPAHARPRELRAGAHGRPRGLRGQAGPQAGAATRRSRTTSTCRSWASASRTWSTGSSAPWWTSTRTGAREVAALDDEVDTLYHQIFDEVLVLMRDDPANVDPGTRILFAVALPRADRRPGDEHRRGHRVPGLGRGRGPEPVSRPRTTVTTTTARSRRPGGRPSADPRRVHRQQRPLDPRRGAAPPPRRRPDRGPLRGHRAQGPCQPAQPARARRGRHLRRRASRSEVRDRVPRPALRLRDHGLRRRPRRLPGRSRAPRVRLHWGFPDPAAVERHRGRAPRRVPRGA